MADRRGVKILAAMAGAMLVAAALVVLGTRGGPVVAPDFVVPDLAGNAVRLSALRGKVVFLNLWATWCPPCRDEMPSMERLFLKLKGRDFAMLAVSSDQEKGAVEAFVTERKLTFSILHDPNAQLSSLYGAWGYPETFLIDRTGKIVEHVIGPRAWDAPDQVARIERLLAAEAP